MAKYLQANYKTTNKHSSIKRVLRKTPCQSLTDWLFASFCPEWTGGFPGVPVTGILDISNHAVEFGGTDLVKRDEACFTLFSLLKHSVCTVQCSSWSGNTCSTLQNLIRFMVSPPTFPSYKHFTIYKTHGEPSRTKTNIDIHLRHGTARVSETGQKTYYGHREF